MTVQDKDKTLDDAIAEPACRSRGRRAHIAGALAEEQVMRHYAARGLRVVHRRWRGSRGEIDLVLRDGDAVVFVEVKSAPTHARAIESLRPAQAGRIRSAAQEFLGGELRGELTEMRLDVALVDGRGVVEVLENALADF
ncbi:MAG: putative endonuclease [Rhodobacteraceae bacterium HLUCCO07]|nr:MAG: putative endonuclease [Rhodobacteraceae bacterium HLUCCO07]